MKIPDILLCFFALYIALERFVGSPRISSQAGSAFKLSIHSFIGELRGISQFQCRLFLNTRISVRNVSWATGESNRHRTQTMGRLHDNNLLKTGNVFLRVIFVQTTTLSKRSHSHGSVKPTNFYLKTVLCKQPLNLYFLRLQMRSRCCSANFHGRNAVISKGIHVIGNLRECERFR